MQGIYFYFSLLVLTGYSCYLYDRTATEQKLAEDRMFAISEYLHDKKAANAILINMLTGNLSNVKLSKVMRDSMTVLDFAIKNHKLDILEDLNNTKLVQSGNYFVSELNVERMKEELLKTFCNRIPKNERSYYVHHNMEPYFTEDSIFVRLNFSIYEEEKFEDYNPVYEVTGEKVKVRMVNPITSERQTINAYAIP